MKKLNVAIIGQGRSGYGIHSEHLRTDDRFRIAAIVDADEYRREKSRKEFGCDVYSDYHELFARNDIDFVVNSTFSYMHIPVTVDLLDHGFNVLCEKPFGSCPADVDRAEAAAKRSGKMLAVFQQSRYAPYFMKIKEVIASGVLGRIVQISCNFDGFGRRWDWQTLRENGAGTLYNTGPHPVDQVLDLMGGTEVPEIFCRMDRVNTFGDAEDYVKLILTLPGKPLVDVQISCCNAFAPFKYNIHAQYGSLIGTDGDLKWKYYNPETAPEQHLVRGTLRTPSGDPTYCKETLEWHEGEWHAKDDEGVFTSSVYMLYTDVYDYLTAGKPLNVTLAAVRRQMAVMEEAHRQSGI